MCCILLAHAIAQAVKATPLLQVVAAPAASADACIASASTARQRDNTHQLNASSDCHECRITRPCKDAQNRLLWRDKTRPART